MKKRTEKGMWKRTIGLFRNIRIPWILYILQVILGVVTTKIALLYIPYETNLKLGNIEQPGVVWGYIGLLLLATVMQIGEQIPAFYATAIVQKNMQDKLISRSVHLPVRAFEKNATQIASWITQDCSYADGLLTSVIGFLTGVVSTYMSVVSMSAIDKTMLYLVPVLLLYIIFSTWFEGKMMFLRERRGRNADAELTAYLSEHLSFFVQIKQLHSQDEEKKRGKEAIQQYYQAEIYQAVLTLINNFVSGSLTSVITILVFLLGIPKVNNGSLTLTDLAAFQSYVLVAYQSFSSVPSLYTSFMYYNGSLFYIAGLMAEKEEVYRRERSMDLENQDIRFENVSFAYGETPVLQNASFTIPKGKVTVIVGPNGSGKTTLFKLVERFYTPDSGTMYFGSYDAETLHLDEWRRKIAYVLQDAQLFNGTIRENICYGINREVSDEEVEAAAKLACADGFIRELSGGYDFMIGENGNRLSGGQRQRIAIARAVMLDPGYLLLDEATCSMDVYSEQIVTDALFRLMEGRTTVLISHDMKILERADYIVVVNQGSIEAEGTVEAVKKSSPMLQSLLTANR